AQLTDQRLSVHPQKKAEMAFSHFSKTTMWIVFVLLFVASTVRTLEKSCEERQFEQIAIEQKADIDNHECRACKMIDLDATANCPKKDYDCDEALPMTSKVLNTGGCDYAQLKCRDASATLVVGGAPVGKVRCNNRMWITPSKSEAVSAVCARKCGLGVCKVLPPSSLEGQETYEPLVVNPPDDLHPCAWGECQNGAVAENDVRFDGFSTFSCSGDGTWTFTGPGAEIRQLKGIRCIKEQPACKKCTIGQVKLDVVNAGAYADTTIDNSGQCTVATIHCNGQFHYAENVDITGQLGSGSGDLKVTCSATGMEWTGGTPPKPIRIFTCG
ncbi:hypothetical protein PENTCL1PPCAC_7722, partial [Pristionchus entomophagus]